MGTDRELREALCNNGVLRLLLARGYHWAWIAGDVALGYFVLGLIIATATHTFPYFIRFRIVYVLLASAVSCVAAACWYAEALNRVVAAIPRGFRVAPEAVVRNVKDWTKMVRLPIPLAFGLGLATLGVGIILVHKETLGFPANLPSWLQIYATALLVVCSTMLGGAVVAYLATMVLYRQLFSYELRLSHYRALAPLSSFGGGLAILAFIAVGLLVLLIFDQIRPASIAVAALGTLGGVLMLIMAQLSFQAAIVRAKRSYFDRLAPAYEQYYERVLQSTAQVEALKEAQEGLEALDRVRKQVQDIPVWLVELSDVTRVAISGLLPVLSLLVNPLIAKVLA